MQNAHPDEFFKFDFPGHEISNENNFIRTFFTLIFASGIETRFSVPLANFFFFFSLLFKRSNQSFISFHHSRIFEEIFSKKICSFYIDFSREAIFDWQTRRYHRISPNRFFAFDVNHLAIPKLYVSKLLLCKNR